MTDRRSKDQLTNIKKKGFIIYINLYLYTNNDTLMDVAAVFKVIFYIIY